MRRRVHAGVRRAASGFARCAWPVLIVSLAACRPEPVWVFVPVTEPDVYLDVRASVREVVVGEPVVLHAQRRYRGEWRRVPRDGLAADQCGLELPPPDVENEVADNLYWQAADNAAAVFNIDFRADRTRTVVFHQPGVHALQARSAVWCGAGRSQAATPILITVREGNGAAG